MSDKFVEVTHTSYFSRLKNAFGGILFGIILFFGSFVLLWLNEGNSARLIKLANYIEKTVIIVPNESVDRINDGKIIFTNGTLTTTETLSDENISFRNTLVLDRNVEMYQWVEEKSKKEEDHLGGNSTTTTTYTYKKKWSNKYHDSSSFKHEAEHQNPEFPIKSRRYNAQKTTFGAFTGTSLQTASISKLIQYENLPENPKFNIINNMYYSGSETPQVGDIRIKYSYAPSGTKVSAIGQQNSDNTISKVITEYGDAYLQSDGLVSKKEVIQEYRDANNFLINILRFVGWLLMFSGLLLLMKPIVIIAKFIPPIANIIEFFSGFILFIVSIILTLITIAIAWLAYRPFWGVTLLLIVAGLIYLLIEYIIKKKHEKAMEMQATPIR